MKTQWLKISGSVLSALLLTAGLLATGSSFAASDDSKKGDFTRGVQAWADNCTRCHDVRDPKELRDDQWITTVYHMRIRAGLTGQQTRDIITFMQGSN